MENILKLTVKRDVFDNLTSGKQNYVYVEGNGYWIRRLATNSADSFDKLKETQDFRTFDTVSVTCAKDNAIYPFKSIRTGNAYEGDNDAEDDGFKIWVEMNEYHNNDEETENYQECESVDDAAEIEECDEEDDELDELPADDLDDEPDDEPDETEECDEVDELDDDTNEDVEECEGSDDTNEETTNSDKILNDIEKIESVEDVVRDIIDILDGYDNVVVVNRPFVTITSNGRIYGTNKRLNINNDEEIRIFINTVKIYDDTNDDVSFVEKIEKYLCEYVKNGHILIYKNGCKLVNDPSGRYMSMKMTKKMYLNR